MEIWNARHTDIEPDRSWTLAWYNTWQPFENDVSQDHLTMCDVRTLDDGDIIEYRYTGYQDMRAAVNAPVFNPKHHWYYHPDLRTDEILVTKQLDPRHGRVSQTPHTSFVDDTAPSDAPPRRSIETRILAVFENAERTLWRRSAGVAPSLHGIEAALL